MGPRAILDAVVKRKIRSLRRESNPSTPIIQPVVQLYTDWAITALVYGRQLVLISWSLSSSWFFTYKHVSETGFEEQSLGLILSNWSLIVGSISQARLMMETDPVFETLCVP
jgi:hypothetical protein